MDAVLRKSQRSEGAARVTPSLWTKRPKIACDAPSLHLHFCREVNMFLTVRVKVVVLLDILIEAQSNKLSKRSRIRTATCSFASVSSSMGDSFWTISATSRSIRHANALGNDNASTVSATMT
jgi:hypothetical protein